MREEYGNPVFGKVSETSPVVQTRYGKVRGFSRNGVGIFKGIPYAGGCSGENRFREADEPASWLGELDGTRNGFYAMQNGRSIGGDPGVLAAYYKGKDVNSTGELEKQGENCLVLDVLTPGLDDGKRPVIFYVHGGGYQTGSGTMAAAADIWCREENLVVVGVNHRLNLFGYLYLGGLSDSYQDSGSVGMSDLVRALEWVRDNIATFGGDPDNVVLMGESGGGMKIINLLTMERAKGLFHKAIVESGSGPAGFFTKEKAAAVTEKFLFALGLSDSSWERLLTLPASVLLKANKAVRPDEQMPTADNINIPDLTQSGYNYGLPDYSSDIPMIIGASEDESALFSTIDDSLTWEGLTDRMVSRGLRDVFWQVRLSREKAKRVVEYLRSMNVKHDSPFHNMMKINSLMGVLKGGAYMHALERAGRKEFTAPVFHYINAYDSARPDDIRYSFAFHTSDLPLQMRIVQRDQDDWISRIMAHAWAAFARTGNPSTVGYSWPAFTEKDRQTMIFDNNGKTRVESDPYRDLREIIDQT